MITKKVTIHSCQECRNREYSEPWYSKKIGDSYDVVIDEFVTDMYRIVENGKKTYGIYIKDTIEPLDRKFSNVPSELFEV